MGPPRWLKAAAGLALLAFVSSCGLPGDGQVQRVEDDTVPYRLLESGSASSDAPDDGAVSDRRPVLVWLVDEGRLSPEATSESCSQAAAPLVERLLAELSAGPSDDARGSGLSTAIPPDSRLTLSGIEAGTAEIDVETASAISADRVPGAVGQMVLTVTSVPGVTAVVLVSDGEPVQVPLPGGALSSGPVTDHDYASLLPERLQEPGILGCARP
jgi:spore germination protein GerM